MAKSQRASRNKANNSRLRSKVFGPVESARTHRLSSKLQELATQPKPERAEMDVDPKSSPSPLPTIPSLSVSETSTEPEKPTTATADSSDEQGNQNAEGSSKSSSFTIGDGIKPTWHPVSKSSAPERGKGQGPEGDTDEWMLYMLGYSQSIDLSENGDFEFSLDIMEDVFQNDMHLHCAVRTSIC